MIKKIVLSVVIIALLVACSSSDESGGSAGNTDNFNRQDMLINWADNIIIPAFQDLSGDLSNLTATKDAFVAAPNQTTLDDLRASWLTAYKTWQYVEMFDIGKAEELKYSEQMNIYPTSVNLIQNNISTGSYDLANPANNAAVGFPAVDYMLFGIASSDTEILNVYTTSTNFEANKMYLSDLINQMETLTSTVLGDWTANYRDVFVNSTGNTATSSTNKLVNDFISYYETRLRKQKIGNPAGVFSTMPLSNIVEAFYNQEVSRELALNGLQAVQDFFNGKSYNSSVTGESLSSYITYLNLIRDGEDLSLLINNQLNVAEGKIQILNTNLAEQVETDNIKMLEAYDELQRAVVFFKVDMVQAMNIQFDYTDNDGD